MKWAYFELMEAIPQEGEIEPPTGKQPFWFVAFLIG